MAAEKAVGSSYEISLHVYATAAEPFPNVLGLQFLELPISSYNATLTMLAGNLKRNIQNLNSYFYAVACQETHPSMRKWMRMIMRIMTRTYFARSWLETMSLILLIGMISHRQVRL